MNQETNLTRLSVGSSSVEWEGGRRPRVHRRVPDEAEEVVPSLAGQHFGERIGEVGVSILFPHSNNSSGSRLPHNMIVDGVVLLREYRVGHTLVLHHAPIVTED